MTFDTLRMHMYILYNNVVIALVGLGYRGKKNISCVLYILGTRAFDTLSVCPGNHINNNNNNVRARISRCATGGNIIARRTRERPSCVPTRWRLAGPPGPVDLISGHKLLTSKMV